MADNPSLESMFTQERNRLQKKLKDIDTQRAKLDEQAAEVQKELDAITAYENVKAGKTATVTVTRARRPRQGGKRDQLVAHLSQHPNQTRADILTSLGAKGNKSEEQSISNALSALKKAGKITASEDGKYRVAAG